MTFIAGRLPQVSSLVDVTKPRSILADARRFFKTDYPKVDFKPIERAFLILKRLYDGRFPGYLACAAAYHDYAHCLSVFAAGSRVLDGCEISGKGLGPHSATETLIAALFHDSGYIREEGDDRGTGAQYTKVHVERSAEFVRKNAAALRLTEASAARVARMILATDLGTPWAGLAFSDEGERRGAEILAAADLLGQMADRAYLEKLLFLYYEFREAGIAGYHSAFDVLAKTAGFYKATRARLDGPLGQVSHASKAHFALRYKIDEDLYCEAIGRQMAYLDQIIADDSSNFRSKLKRMNFKEMEQDHGALSAS